MTVAIPAAFDPFRAYIAEDATTQTDRTLRKLASQSDDQIKRHVRTV